MIEIKRARLDLVDVTDEFFRWFQLRIPFVAQDNSFVVEDKADGDHNLC
uniref:Uncharacterized protein n=1 Tax=Arundo donax TaxID=35708 RepID=A0A0A9AUP7_ARUDO